MDIYDIYKKFENQFIGYLVVQHYKSDGKQLSKKDIHLLTRLSFNLWNRKRDLLSSRYMATSGTMFAINRRTAVKFMGAYLGNYWASYCNLNEKIGLLNITSDDYGQKNVYVGLCDQGLEEITQQMYKELEDLYATKNLDKECA